VTPRQAQPRIAVIGLGSTGSFTVRHLAALGAYVVGYEQYGRGHDHGAYAGDTRLFRLLYGEGADYTELLIRARELWLEFQAEQDAKLFSDVGLLTIGPSESAWMGEMEAAARRAELPIEVIDRATVRRRYPLLAALGDGDYAIFDPLAGLVRTNEAVLHAINSAERWGAEIHDWARVQAIEETGREVRVWSNDSCLAFDRAVVCTGPWSGELVTSATRPVAIDYTLHAVRSIEHTAGVFPPAMLMTGATGSEMVCSTQPMSDSRFVKYFSTSSRYPEDGCPARTADGISARDHRLDLAAMHRIAADIDRRLPSVFPQPVRGYRFYDSYTRDHQPVLGWLPGSERLLVLDGLSGHGFKLAPVYGEMIARLAVGAPVKIPDSFDPRRFTPAQTQTRAERPSVRDDDRLRRDKRDGAAGLQRRSS